MTVCLDSIRTILNELRGQSQCQFLSSTLSTGGFTTSSKRDITMMN